MKSAMKEAITAYIEGLGVDDVGFASLDAYVSPNTPKIESFFPEAKTIIVMAYRELSTVDSLDVRMAINGRLDKGQVMRYNSYQVCKFLEEEYGAKIISIPVAFPRGDQSAVSLRHAAKAAGLGTFGRNNLIIHPKFGARVMFTAIVTDLELPADPQICEEQCINCNICVKKCPAQALDEPGKTDMMKCIKVSQPYSFVSYMSFLDEFIDAPKEERREKMKSFAPYYQAAADGGHYYCYNCLKLCPVGKAR